MTEMVKPLRDMIPLRKYKGGGPLQWDPATSKPSNTANKPSPTARNYFLEDTVTPILQTDASDYGVGGYLYSVINGKVRVIRFFSKALVGAQLNWSARKKECYGCLLYTSPSPRDRTRSRMPSSA